MAGKRLHKASGGKGVKIVRIYGCGGEGGQEKQGKRFTIITKPHKNRKGYIIMEIMSTNVTINTRYRGEF